jgi:hypothetical protein
MAAFRNYVFPVSHHRDGSLVSVMTAPTMVPFEQLMQGVLSGQSKRQDIVAYVRALFSIRDAQELQAVKDRLNSANYGSSSHSSSVRRSRV